MRFSTIALASAAVVLAAALGAGVRAQQEAYPQRPPVAQAVLDRGKALYSVHCAFCHGAEARGGDGGGPNLLRSQLVLSDQKGELIGEVVTNGRPNTPMQPIKLTADQIADIAAFIHSFRVGGYDITRQPPASILVGNATAGEAVFRTRCASCHSTTGDLKGIASKIPDAKDLQQMWLMPSAGSGPSTALGAGRGVPIFNIPPTAATVTPPSGQTVTGRLIRIDDFLVTVAQPDGTTRSFNRNGDVPKVVINDPLKPHRDLLGKYTDADIHNITAYLATIK